MFDLGMQEIVVIFVVALLVFGPKKLPELGRSIGKVLGQFRTVISDVKTEVNRELHIAESELDLKELPAWQKKDAGPATKESAPKQGVVENEMKDIDDEVRDVDKEADKKDV